MSLKIHFVMEKLHTMTQIKIKYMIIGILLVTLVTIAFVVSQKKEKLACIAAFQDPQTKAIVCERYGR